MLIASATYQREGWSSPTIDPASSGQSFSTLKAGIAEVKNQPSDFDSKPSCWSFIKRVFASVFRHIVRVFQKTPSGLDSPAESSGAVRTLAQSGLMMTTPEPMGTLLFLDHLVRETSQDWAKQHQDRASLYDADKRGQFINATLITLLESHTPEECTQMLDNLNGDFGNRLRGVLDFVAFKIGFNDAEPETISRARNLMTHLSYFPIALCERLSPQDVSAISDRYKTLNDYTEIGHYHELSYQQTAALAAIGFSAQMLGG
ncbi:hypothetical protein SODG_005530 [Sodalis praecaptivus]|uniref:hypothetical protein n=1 Tax=Sodalis praecaptivus TaxID=1239307 RepID=UPI002800583C|nr:hypothetical protein [Sodalis praecaptivus]CAJ0996395.1 hypothetical protein NVIRENTERO_02375 [Sodalis praecaptivus]